MYLLDTRITVKSGHQATDVQNISRLMKICLNIDMLSSITFSSMFICNTGLMYLIIEEHRYFNKCTSPYKRKWIYKNARTDEYSVESQHIKWPRLCLHCKLLDSMVITHLKFPYAEACHVIICWEAFEVLILSVLLEIICTWLQYRNCSFIILQQKMSCI